MYDKTKTENKTKSLKFQRTFDLNPSQDRDEHTWFRISFENRHQAWTNQVYFMRV